MERVLEKLKTEDKNIQLVVDELIKQCEREEGFKDKVLNEKKSLKECWEYIRILARKEAIDGVATIDNQTVYGWAIHYFDEEELEELKKPAVSKSSIPTKSIKQKPNKVEEDDEEDIEDDDEEVIEEVKPIQKKIIKKPKGVPEGQISLFDL